MAGKTLYLSPKGDGDLLLLHSQLGSKLFAKLVKESLRMTVRPGYHPKVLDKLVLDPFEDAPLEPVAINISFTAKKDGDIRKLLEKVKPRKTGYVMKMALRFAIGPYFVIGSQLNSKTSVSKDFRSKELFFIGDAREVVVVNSLPMQTAPVSTHKEIENTPPAPEITELPVMKEEPVISGEFDDDDILAMLDMM